MTKASRTEASVQGPIARRLLGLFILCSVVPTTWFAFFTEGRVTTSLLAEGDRQLASTAKWQGVQIFERLTTVAERVGNHVVEESHRPGSFEGELRAFDPLRGLVSAFGVINARTQEWVAGDAIPPPLLNDRERRHLESGRSVLHSVQAKTRADAGFVLVHEIDADRWLVSVLLREAVWGPDSVSIDRDRIDVFSFEGPISEEAMDENLDVASILTWGTRDLEPFEWSHDEEVLRSSLWTLPLEFTFGCSPWTVIASTSREEILSPIRGYRSTFYRLVLITALAVCFLGLRMIRRQVEPLSVILRGTRSVAGGDLRTRIELDRRDEFGVLADDFNAMTEQLERHFHTNATVRAVTEVILGASELDAVILRLLEHLPRLLPDASIQVLIDAPIGVERHWLPGGGENVRPVIDIVALDEVPRAQLLELEESWVKVAGDYAWLERLVSPSSSDAATWFFPMTVTEKFLGAIVVSDDLGLERRQFVRQIANQGAIALSNTRLISSLESMSWETLCVLARTVDAKSPWTAGHSDRVAHTSRKFAAAMGLEETDQERIYRAALLHDVGKVGIPIELLDKASPLSAREYEVIQEHVLTGCRILGSVETFAPLLPTVRSHHERFDGNGYPDGLKGTDIPLDARIVAVADAYDAMVTDRPYREGIGQEEALRRIRAGTGTQFDPECVGKFLEMMSLNPDALLAREVKG